MAIAEAVNAEMVAASPCAVFVRLVDGRTHQWVSYMGADGLMDAPPDNEVWYGLDRIDLTGYFVGEPAVAPCRVYAGGGEFVADDWITPELWAQMEPRYRGEADDGD